MLTVTIDALDEGRTLASWLRNRMPNAPRAFLGKLVRSGAANVNGAPPDRPLQGGDVVNLRASARVIEQTAQGPCILDVVYDDPDILILNKPVGFPTHPVARQTGADVLQIAQGLATGLEHDGTYHAVNRLDRWTSGILLLAPGARRAAAWARLFQERRVDKRYLACVAGHPPAEGTVEMPVDGQDAITQFRTLACHGGIAMLLVHPHTGRKHQVRRHLAGVGCPLLGDTRYGDGGRDGLPGALLHAAAIALPHPGTGGELRVFAPLPATWQPFLRKLSIKGVAGIVMDAL